MKKFHLTVAKIDGLAFEGEVQSVSVPGVEGEMTILADHEAIISPLKSGTIVINSTDENSSTVSIEKGTLEVSNNKATVLF